MILAVGCEAVDRGFGAKLATRIAGQGLSDSCAFRSNDSSEVSYQLRAHSFNDFSYRSMPRSSSGPCSGRWVVQAQEIQSARTSPSAIPARLWPAPFQEGRWGQWSFCERSKTSEVSTACRFSHLSHPTVPSALSLRPRGRGLDPRATLCSRGGRRVD